MTAREQPRPSRTATKISRLVLLLDADPRLRCVLAPGSAATVEVILRASGVVPQHDIDTMRSTLTLRFFETAERLFGRGQIFWLGVRKRWMADVVEQSIASGARQLLVVGSGFDPLAVMMAHKHAEVFCVEVDTPSTASPKRTGIEGAGLACSNHLVLDANLASSPLDELLGPSGWRNNVRSVVVAEGLLMYLRPVEVESFFAQVRRCTVTGSRLAFSSLSEDKHHRPRLQFGGALFNHFVRTVLSLSGEAMHWGVLPTSIPEFLRAKGFYTIEQPTIQSLRERFLDPVGLHDEPLSPYDHLVLAEIGL